MKTKILTVFYHSAVLQMTLRASHVIVFLKWAIISEVSLFQGGLPLEGGPGRVLNAVCNYTSCISLTLNRSLEIFFSVSSYDLPPPPSPQLLVLQILLWQSLWRSPVVPEATFVEVCQRWQNLLVGVCVCVCVSVCVLVKI